MAVEVTSAPMEVEPESRAQRVAREQNASLPWVEKYRPKQMDELVSHEEIISTITRLIDAGKLPHLLLYGPPGTGKTSTVLACAHKLYGKHFASMVLELNASDDRGIDVVRDQIKEFVSTRQMYTTAPKMVILDEADNMTSAAQFALRRVIEKYTKNARFCLICNYASKLIPALQSRCTRFRFAPLSQEQAMSRTRVVAEAEGVKVADHGLEACIRLGIGDMRRCLNILQSTHMAFGQVTELHVYQCTGSPMPADVEQVLRWLLQEDFVTAFNNIWQLMTGKGLALQDILTELHNHVLLLEIKDQIKKAMLVASLSDVEHRLSVGTSEKLQLGGLVGIFQEAAKGIAAA